MVLLLVILFVAVPILELAIFVQVSNLIGFFPALALIVLFSVSGAWLVKKEGLGVWRRANTQLERGEVPAAELVNGVLILLAGALMLVPGFLTDALGLLLLIPPTRALVRLLLLRRFERRVRAAFEAPVGAMFGAPFGPDGFDTGFAGAGERVFVGEATYGPGSGPAAIMDVREVEPDDTDRA